MIMSLGLSQENIRMEYIICLKASVILELIRYMCYSDPLKVSWGQNISSSLVAKEKEGVAQCWQSSQGVKAQNLTCRASSQKWTLHGLGDQRWSSTPSHHQRRGQLARTLLALSWCKIPQLLYFIAPTARGWQSSEAEITEITAVLFRALSYLRTTFTLWSPRWLITTCFLKCMWRRQNIFCN